MAGGTHGSLKEYTFSVNKDTLQKVVMKVIHSNPNIARDTSLDYLGSSPFLDSSECYNCPAGENYYNDIKHYVTITISSGLDTNEYTFRYYGDDKDWETSLSSEIFICYAYDKLRRGGSEGNGGVESKVLKQLTDVFESEFVNKINKELNLHHNETTNWRTPNVQLGCV